jgi:SAM-dependent methyltransferase
MAFYGTQALISAVELDVFTQLADGPLTLEQARSRLGLDPRCARDFLDTLVALELLDRDESGYASTPAAAAYLDRRKDSYVGGYALMAKHYLMPVWGKLTDALRSGSPQVPTSGGFFDGYKDSDAAERFLGAMDAVNGKVGQDLTTLIDWTGYTSFVDVGGARGNLAATLVRTHPALTATVFDLPQIEPFFRKHLEALGLADRIAYSAGDFFQDPLPSADVHILGHILHYYGPDERRQLLKAVYDAVNPGGGIAIYDRMIDEDRRGEALSLLGSLNMLLTSEGGREYTVSECQEWLLELGFEVHTTQPIGGLDILVFATKPTAAEQAA